MPAPARNFPYIRTSARLRRTILSATVAALAVLALPLAAQAAPSPGWRLIGATGPTNLPPEQSEVQRVVVSAEGGTFTLSPSTAQGKGTLTAEERRQSKGGLASYAAGVTEITFLTIEGKAPFVPFEVGQEIVSGTGIPSGTAITAVSSDGKTITLSQPTTAGGFLASVEALSVTPPSKQITGVSTAFGAFHVGDAITGTGIPAEATVTAVEPPGTLTISQNPTAGGTVSLAADETTGPIDFDAPPAGAWSIAQALEALPAFGPGSVTVVGGPGGPGGEPPYSITFEGPFAEQDIPQMNVDATGLTGSSPNASVRTFRPGGPGTAELAAYATNVGGGASSGPIKVAIGPLPSGITATTAPGANGTGWTCAPAAGGPSLIECESSASVASGQTANPVILPLGAGAGAPASSHLGISVRGGGAPGLSEGLYEYDEPLIVSSQPARPGVQSFWAGAFGEDGLPSTQAGGHANLAGTGLLFNTKLSAAGGVIVAADAREVDVELPPGFLGNPLVTPRCPQSTLLPKRGPELCTEGSRVGFAKPVIQFFGTGANNPEGVYNDQPPFGYPAEFTFPFVEASLSVLGSVRSDTDYGITIEAPDIPVAEPAYGSFLTLFGSPTAAAGKAFLTNPTDCAEEARSAPTTTIKTNSWQDQNPDLIDNEITVALPPVTTCGALAGHFNPGFGFQPQTSQAASPSAFTARLAIPQEGLTDPAGLVAPQLKKAVVTLPRGLDVNPSSANGLAACTEAQIGLTTTSGALPNPIRFDKSVPSCPDASKLGTVEAKSPLLEETLAGTIYLAAQDENPFRSLLALYLVIDSPKNGILVKLPGEVRPDQQTGQLTATFDNNPQLPVEGLTLHFRGGGPRSPLATPAVCSTYTTHGELTPWSAPESGPAAQTGDSFPITAGPGGGACATSEAGRPFAPSFEAGTMSTAAGAYSPLVIKLARRDGEQELTRLGFTLPPGLTARLAGIPYCSDAAIAAAAGRKGRAELASPSCPAASQFGSVDTAAGVGPQPIHVGGHVYLAGPYRGAPLSAVVITPAVAGPFDLGTVVVRTPLFVNPETAQITARSDDIPHILKGIPLQLRSVEIKVDRQGYTLNPTSCDPMRVSSTISGLNGATATPSSRFQVGGCRALKFHPKLKLSLKGATKRTGHPALKAVVTYPKGAGYANIARAQVGLPHSEFLDQSNLDKVCRQADLRAGTCPKRSIYGYAKAWTPLLDKPLQGPVYLGVGFGYKLPALVADLNGQIRIMLVGKVDTTKHEGIRNTFEVVPDAPVSRFVLRMKGGKKYGLLVNSENVCRKKQRASALFNAQNGLRLHMRPKIHNDCGKKKHQKKAKGHSTSKAKPHKQKGKKGRGAGNSALPHRLGSGW